MALAKGMAHHLRVAVLAPEQGPAPAPLPTGRQVAARHLQSLQDLLAAANATAPPPPNATNATMVERVWATLLERPSARATGCL